MTKPLPHACRLLLGVILAVPADVPLVRAQSPQSQVLALSPTDLARSLSNLKTGAKIADFATAKYAAAGYNYTPEQAMRALAEEMIGTTSSPDAMALKVLMDRLDSAEPSMVANSLAKYLLAATWVDQEKFKRDMDELTKSAQERQSERLIQRFSGYDLKNCSARSHLICNPRDNDPSVIARNPYMNYTAECSYSEIAGPDEKPADASFVATCTVEGRGMKASNVRAIAYEELQSRYKRREGNRIIYGGATSGSFCLPCPDSGERPLVQQLPNGSIQLNLFSFPKF